MSTLTTRHSLYKPAADGSETVDVVTDLNNNWDKIDALLGFLPCTSGTRPGSPYEGQAIYETDTNKAYGRFEAAWVQIPLSTGAVFTGNLDISGTVAANAAMTVTRAGATNPAYNMKVSGDANNRLEVTAEGKHNWGPGSAVADTNLFRTSANVLRTDDSFSVGTDLTVTGTSTFSGNVAAPTITGNVSIGGNLTVSGVGAVITKYKSADQSVTSSTTLVSDSNLFFPVLASQVWQVQWDLRISSGTTEDGKLAINFPAGTQAPWGYIGYNTSALVVPPSADSTVLSDNTFTIGGTGTAATNSFHMTACIFVGGTAGNITLRYAQNTSGVNSFTMKKGSTMIATRLA